MTKKEMKRILKARMKRQGFTALKNLNSFNSKKFQNLLQTASDTGVCIGGQRDGVNTLFIIDRTPFDVGHGNAGIIIEASDIDISYHNFEMDVDAGTLKVWSNTPA